KIMEYIRHEPLAKYFEFPWPFSQPSRSVLSLHQIRFYPFLRNRLTCYTKHTLKQQLTQILTVAIKKVALADQ
ncbi:hypothetical protein ACLJB8_09415, partial [Campylobacter coli]|uniref:hypothetical protein n=1 Tax=Campylobacter coli TaxID=195 RepID=UPI003F7C6CD9